MIGSNYEDFPEEIPEDWDDHEGFSVIPPEDLLDEPRYLLPDDELFRMMCNIANAICPLLGKKLHENYNLVILEDLEGRICHIHRTKTNIPEEVAFRLEALPESGDATDRIVKTISDVRNAQGPHAYYSLRETLQHADERPLISYYVETSRS